MAIEMMQTAFRCMRIAMHVEVMGDIVGSSAMHHSDWRVNLMDINFGDHQGKKWPSRRWSATNLIR